MKPKFKKSLSILLSFLLVLEIAFAFPKTISASETNEDIIFKKTFGGDVRDELRSVIKTSDGGFVATGITYSNNEDLEGLSHGNGDALIVKYDASGNVLWKNVFGGSNYDVYTRVIELQDGSYLVVGYSYSSDADLNEFDCDNKWIYVKYDVNGNMLWKKIKYYYNNYYWDYWGTEFELVSVSKTSDGGFIISEDSNEESSQKIIKFDLNGDIQWETRVNIQNTLENTQKSVIQASDGGYVVVGRDGQNNTIIKLDSQGNEQWKKNLLGSQGTYNSVVQTTDGGYVVVGNIYQYEGEFQDIIKGQQDAIIAKYDSDGNIVWLKGFGGTYNDSFNQIILTQDNNFIVVGSSESYDYDMAGLYKGSSEAIIVKYDINGIIQSKNSFGGSYEDCFYSVDQISNDEFVAVGYSRSDDMQLTGLNKGDYDAIVVGFKDSYLKFTSVEGISLDKTSKTIKVGESLKLNYSIAPIEATNKNVVWESSDNNIATVDELGYVKGISPGIATITVRTLDGNYTATCQVNVGQLNLVELETFGYGNYECFNKIITTNDGEIVAVGEANYSSVFGTNKGWKDAIIAIYDKDYNVQFKHSFGGSNQEVFKDVIKTSDDGYVTVGYSDSTDKDMYGLNKGSTDAIIVKYDNSGNIVWKKSFGGYNSDVYYSVIEDTDGGYIAVGESSSSSLDMDGLYKGGNDAIYVKYDKNGNIVWKKTFGGSSDDKFYSAIKSSDGGFIAVGIIYSNDGDLQGLKNTWYYDLVIVKFNGNGDVVWTKTIGDDSYNGKYLYSVIKTSDNNFVAAGYMSGNAVILKFDNEGNVIWQQSFGDSNTDAFNSVIETPNGDYIAVGYSDSKDGDMSDVFFGQYSSDAIVVKYNKDGEKIYQFAIGGSEYETINSIALTNENDYLVAGVSHSNDYDFKNLNHGSGDAFIAKIKDLSAQKVDVSGVSLNINSKVLTIGQTTTLVANITPLYASNKTLTWSTSNPNVATVDENGNVTAIAEGTATITVTTVDGGYQDTCEIAVEPLRNVEGVILDITNATLKIGDSIILTPSIAPANATNKKVTWTSSNTNVATVDWQGKVYAKGIGNAVITVKTEDGGYEVTCQVTVEPIKVTGVTLNSNNKTLKLGDKATLIAVIEPLNATNKNITWTSENTSVATVDSNGVVTAVGIGETTIIAKTEDGEFTASCQVFVEPIETVPVNISITKHEVAVNNTVDVLININNVPVKGISAADFIVNFDSTKLEVVNIVAGDTIKDARDFSYNIKNNTISFLFADETSDDSRSIRNNGTFAKITFKVLDNCGVGMIPISIEKVGSIVSPILTKYTYSTENGYIESYKYGDISGDGDINLYDYILLKSYILNNINKFDYKFGMIVADLNQDNEITSLDYLALKRYILGRIKELPVK